MKLRKNDTIKVISGDDKGKTGVISRVYPQADTILVDGVNTYKKHQKQSQNQSGGVVTLSRPIQVSKVALLCPNCHKTTKVAISGTGAEKTRLCRHCQKPIITKALKS
ncbi:50S ribosomal protein L24 [Candidatus Collierbacteria bacterium RIFOXYB1_FULL_49_13]|uniref:Large ribosomal subunit protein uL24 n=1 Tax=Candidatus Collierbacteria bacterium RIFOXYB1_FULL_49_13 TaxID=1817728 RepID=A0A1F5FHJ9_9BACT|nr:ribosomal protein L24 [uncultured bacterium]OGD79128.1 MAG: 50S ribosomal protein L24 [Candidatus Collierbacteria bacterium RIFOXYB1_FULL_49_13]